MGNQSQLKKISKIALLAIGVLFIGSIVFFKEQLFADTSYIVFSIINYKHLAIQNQRIGAFITQVVPYLGQQFHLPIKTILISYVISFDLFYLIVASLLVYRYKQYGLAILMALCLYLFVSDSYFWIYDELHLALGWMFLFFGVTLYLGNKKVNILLLLVPFLLLSFLAISTHYVVIIPTAFLWIYFIIEKKNWPFSRNITILLSTLLIAVIVVKFIATAGSQPYEKSHLHHMTHFSIRDILNSFGTPVIKMFCYRCITNYWIAVVIFIIDIVVLARGRQMAVLAWLLTSCLGYFILMGLTYGDLDKYVRLFHIETEWKSFGIIIAAPFVFTFLPRIKQRMAAAALILIFIIRLAYIGHSAQAFVWRVNFHEQVLAQMKKKGITKLALYVDSRLRDKYILDWCAPYESLLTSAMDGDDPQLTFLFVNPNNKQTLEEIQDPKKLYNTWSMMPYNELNKEYFNFDTTKPYRAMTYDEFLK